MELSDYIASIALIISSLAALYSRWSAKAAEKANNIALHDPKVRIYLELRNFQNGFRGFQAFPNEYQLEEFYERSVVLSELYFSPEISKQFNTAYDECWSISRQIMALEYEEDVEVIRNELKSKYNLLNKKIIWPLVAKVKDELEILNA